ncbi:hypothetical protein N9H39_07580 [Gammaproteobacteria bacterium]|nr:hypothetical protein [Gammaproteobacteria bacterium]
MRGEIEGYKIAALVRRYARLLGLRLELEPNSGTLTVIATEIQTGVRLTDLPGMEETGCWQSWPDCLAGLNISRKRR